MARHKNVDWNLPLDSGNPNRHTWDSIHTALLMDLRDELQRLNSLMHCSHVVRGFLALSKIASRDESAFKRRVAAAARKRVARGKR